METRIIHSDSNKRYDFYKENVIEALFPPQIKKTVLKH